MENLTKFKGLLRLKASWLQQQPLKMKKLILLSLIWQTTNLYHFSLRTINLLMIFPSLDKHSSRSNIITNLQTTLGLSIQTQLMQQIFPNFSLCKWSKTYRINHKWTRCNLFNKMNNSKICTYHNSSNNSSNSKTICFSKDIQLH